MLSASLLEGRDAVNLLRPCVEFISFDYDIGIIHGRESFFPREDGDIVSHIRLYHSPWSCSRKLSVSEVLISVLEKALGGA